MFLPRCRHAAHTPSTRSPVN
uniref:Uncharacterized protein n=1 Tax=Oryza punctata TaxID=4537 RepID=A0A0E0MBP1_ORYPU